MAVSVVRGLILKEIYVGDADKILTVLAKDVGKISVGAKNARQTRNGLSASTAAFTYGDFTVRTGVKNNFLQQADIISSFYSVTQSLETMAYASCILELTDKVTSELLPANDILFLAVNLLKKLADGKIRPALTLPLFELKLLQYSGFMPHLQSCVDCGGEHSCYLSPTGTLCEDCAKKYPAAIKTNDTILYIMRYILSNEPPKLLSFNIDDELVKPLCDTVFDMVKAHLNLNLKSLKFVDALELR